MRWGNNHGSPGRARASAGRARGSCKRMPSWTAITKLPVGLLARAWRLARRHARRPVDTRGPCAKTIDALNARRVTSCRPAQPPTRSLASRWRQLACTKFSMSNGECSSGGWTTQHSSTAWSTQHWAPRRQQPHWRFGWVITAGEQCHVPTLEIILHDDLHGLISFGSDQPMKHSGN